MGKFEGKFPHKEIDKTQHDPNRAFVTGHIEHTKLDVFLVCPNTNLIMGRPYLTLLVDEYSRGLLATNVSLEPPSYKSIEETIQECIKKHSRLPNTIKLEQVYGKSKELNDLIHKYNFNLEVEPKQNSGYKSRIEKLFKLLDEKLSVFLDELEE
jgi:putative transposase